MTDQRQTQSTAQEILIAARGALLESGFAALSTRKVADRAGVPLSQIHYHFGSKEQLILTMLNEQNTSLVQRQAEMFALDVPLSERWERACNYLDDDLESGYVRVLQEMAAAGWSSPQVRAAVTRNLDAWSEVLTDVVGRAQAAGANLGPFRPQEVAALVASVFLGAESMLLLERDGDAFPIRAALHRIGEAIVAVEPSASES